MNESNECPFCHRTLTYSERVERGACWECPGDFEERPSDALGGFGPW